MELLYESSDVKNLIDQPDQYEDEPPVNLTLLRPNIISTDQISHSNYLVGKTPRVYTPIRKIYKR